MNAKQLLSTLDTDEKRRTFIEAVGEDTWVKLHSEAAALSKYRSEMSIGERVDFLRDFGREAFDKLPWKRSEPESRADTDAGDGSDGEAEQQQTGDRQDGPRRGRMTSTQKVAYIREHGEAAYHALPRD